MAGEMAFGVGEGRGQRARRGARARDGVLRNSGRAGWGGCGRWVSSTAGHGERDVAEPLWDSEPLPFGGGLAVGARRRELGIGSRGGVHARRGVAGGRWARAAAPLRREVLRRPGGDAAVPRPRDHRRGYLGPPVQRVGGAWAPSRRAPSGG